MDRAVFDLQARRFYRPASAAQQSRWFEAWQRVEQQPAELAGIRDLLQPENASIVHGLAWWEDGSGQDTPSDTDVLNAFLSTSAQLDAAPLPHCPPTLVGVWRSAEGHQLTLAADGSYTSSAPAENGRWRMHRSVMEELWIQLPRASRRVLEVLRNGDSMTLRDMAGTRGTRWRRAPSAP